MTGWRRLAHLQDAVVRVIRDRIPGDFAELGTFRGGSAIFLRACLEALDPTDPASNSASSNVEARRVYVADVFHEEPEDFSPFSPWRVFFVLAAVHVARALAFIPISAWRRWYARALMKPLGFVHDPNAGEDTLRFILEAVRGADTMALVQHNVPTVRGGYENVRSHFARFGLLDDRVRFLRGWFAEAVPRAEFRRLALLRLDGDLYASTRDGLETCYGCVSPGGVIIIDDYNAFDDCRRAVDEFRTARGITAPILDVDAMCSYWIKGTNEPVVDGPQLVSPRA